MNRSQEIIRTSWIGIIANVLLAGFKAAVGILAGSVMAPGEDNMPPGAHDFDDSLDDWILSAE